VSGLLFYIFDGSRCLATRVPCISGRETYLGTARRKFKKSTGGVDDKNTKKLGTH